MRTPRPRSTLAVVQDGKVALAKGYGQRDVEANLHVTPTTQFLIGSITKSFTATGVALLHDEGRLDWTKPVRDYIPEFRLPARVSLRMRISRSPATQWGSAGRLITVQRGAFVRGYIGAAVDPRSAGLFSATCSTTVPIHGHAMKPVAPKVHTDPNGDPNFPNTPNTAAAAQALSARLLTY